MRYEVRIITQGNMGSNALGTIIASTDDAREAKQIAEQKAPSYYFGTAVRDTQSHTVDCGDAVYSDSDFSAIA